MPATSSKGLKICITGAAPAITTPIVPTAIAAVASTATTPAGVKVSAPTLPAVGEVVYFKDTGFSSLDGRGFVVTKLDGTTDFEIGNIILGTGTLGTSPKIEHYVEATDMTCLCLSSLSISQDTPGVISTATFCDATSSIPEVAVSAGTLSFSGYVDVNAKDYPALLLAAEDSKPRIVRIMLPNNQGYIVANATFSNITWDLPLSGAIGFSGTATLGSQPVHVW